MLDFGTLMLFSLGFLLGVKHASEADHIAAVSTIVSRRGSIFESSMVGISWGLGHTFTLFIAGIAVLALKLTIPEKAVLFMEFVIGAMLVALGISSAKDFVLEKLHIHRHAHGGHVHLHFHMHVEDHEHKHRLKLERRALAIGMVHGLAGSAALMLLVLATAGSIYQGLLYILLFGVGSIAGMVLITALLGFSLFRANAHFGAASSLRAAVGFLSIGIGTAMMLEVGLRMDMLAAF